MGAQSSSFRLIVALLTLLVAVGIGCSGDDGDDGNPGPAGPAGPAGPSGPPGDIDDPVAAIEACIGCHATNAVVPVGDIRDTLDAHFVDTDPFGPLTAAGYRQLDVALSSVDATGSTIVIDFEVFDVTSAGSAPVADILASDGRFTLARLALGAAAGDPTSWQRIVDGERFTTSGGVFENLGGGMYRYTSVFDPTSEPIVGGDSLRLAIQISASDLPAGNGWCDFDADLGATNTCSPVMVTLTRDIVQTATCNECHGVTPDAQLAFHGGGRTQVEYCVTCHNPDIGETDMTVLIHKIHAGSSLENGFRGYSHVSYTKDLDDCTTCHTGGGIDEDNWYEVPSREACGSCHDDVDFDTGVNHGMGGIQMSNAFCLNCHPPTTGPVTASLLPTRTAHHGVARSIEGARYRGGPNGLSIDSATWDSASDRITVDYSVTRDGTKAMLEADPEWTGGSMNIKLAWPTSEYTNEGSGISTPAQPVTFNARAIGSVATALGGGNYRMVINVPSDASGTATVDLEGYPVADLDADGSYTDRISVRSQFAHVNIEPRAGFVPRRRIVDIDKCNDCHDSSGAGISLHGSNRVSEDQVCAICHNPNATDIARRPADPSTTPDGKAEESIDLKRMIHQIHRGSDLENGVVYYGFGGSVNDFSDVDFIGSLKNCETCHLPDTYSTEVASATSPSTIDTGADRMDPDDDLNISPVTAACSSCHDDSAARDHMLLNGASFQALDEDIR